MEQPVECSCGMKFRNPVYPLYCKCGKILGKTCEVDALASNQPGTELAKLIGTWFQPKTTGCQRCNDRILKMNSWGVIGCVENKKTIVEWLVEAAKDNNIPAPRFVISLVVSWAIHKARKRTHALPSQNR